MIVAKYIFFAIISMGVNILTQHLVLLAYGGAYSLYTAMACGTIAGFVIKYILDKRYIFYYTSRSHFDTVKKFILYSLNGVVTTGVFWCTEIGFDLVLKNSSAKYYGAVVGLSVGYLAKYWMDKRIVFGKEEKV
ncbi:GtrA family protein [bacterium]|nr:GtrA family protein [bacterium]